MFQWNFNIFKEKRYKISSKIKCRILSKRDKKYEKR